MSSSSLFIFTAVSSFLSTRSCPCWATTGSLFTTACGWYTSITLGYRSRRDIHSRHTRTTSRRTHLTLLSSDGDCIVLLHSCGSSRSSLIGLWLQPAWNWHNGSSWMIFTTRFMQTREATTSAPRDHRLIRERSGKNWSSVLVLPWGSSWSFLVLSSYSQVWIQSCKPTQPTLVRLRSI